MTIEITTKEDTQDPTVSLTENILGHIDGIPLPPVVKKNLWKSVNRLITGLVDVPVAYLEAKVQQIKTKADALTLVTNNAAETAAKEFGQDQFLIDRTVNHFGSRLLREQINRETTVNLAVEDLRLNPPKEDSKTDIEPDWLETFSRISETKSNEEMQMFLAKILSGEIRNPGTFSPKTIQTLSMLDQATGKIFQSFCNVSFEIPQAADAITSVICEPFGSPGNNGLSPIGLSYTQLTRLQDAGLIQHDLNAWRQIPAQLLTMPTKVGSVDFLFKLSGKTPEEKIKMNVINFTVVGLELRKVIQISSNETYNQKYLEWVTTKFQLTRT